MIIPSYHIKRKILTTVIAPHGITDLIHASQYNTTQQLLSINTFCLLSSIGLSQNEATTLGLDFCFVIASAIHFRHDLKVLIKDKCQEKHKCVFSIVVLLSFLVNQDLFFWYMSILHVPNHYFTNKQIISKQLIFNLTFILSFTLFLSFMGDQDILFCPFFYPIYKGVIMSHVAYQELYVHNRFLSD